jgi:hypothetical protein
LVQELIDSITTERENKTMADEHSTEPTAMQKAAGGCAKLFGYGVVGMALIFADIAFLVLIGGAFGSNPVFQAGAFLGAFTTSASVFGLLIGKARWFRPGNQLLAAYGFTVIEGIVMGMNVALCYAIYRHTDGNIVFQVWQMISPWTPLIAGAGWVILFQLDPAQQRRHDLLEQEDKQIEAELSYNKLVFNTRMKVKRSAVTMLQTELEQEIVTPERRLAIQQAAQAMADEILSDMSGQHIFVRRATVQGTGYTLPSQQSLPAPTQQPPVEQESQSLLDKAKHKLGWQKPVQPSSAPVVPPQTDSTPVQPFSHTDALEQLYNTDPQGFAAIVEAIRQKSQQSPLQQPPLNTNQASQSGSQNGAH